MDEWMPRKFSYNQAIEIQLFRKFISRQKVFHSSWPNGEIKDVLKLLVDCSTLQATTCNEEFYVHILNHSSIGVISSMNSHCKLLPPIKKKGFTMTDLKTIDSYFLGVFDERYCKTLVLHKESKSSYFNGELYGSFFSRHQNSSLALAYISRCGASDIKPCFITKFVQCSVYLTNPECSNDYVLVQAFPLEEHQQKEYYPHPVTIWKKPEDNELIESSIYFPCSHLICRCAYTSFSTDLSNPGITVIPCNHFYGIMQ